VELLFRHQIQDCTSADSQKQNNVKMRKQTVERHTSGFSSAYITGYLNFVYVLQMK
jgi:ATP-dependent Zn protease